MPQTCSNKSKHLLHFNLTQALHSICNVGGKEFSDALSTEVLKLLTDSTTKTFVRKKAALTTLRLYRKSPDMLPASEWADRILLLLDEKNIGVLTSVSSLILGILNACMRCPFGVCFPKYTGNDSLFCSQLAQMVGMVLLRRRLAH